MAKVIELYVPKNFRNAFVPAGQPNRERLSSFLRRQRSSPDSTNWRGPPVAPAGSDGVEPYCRKSVSSHPEVA